MKVWRDHQIVSVAVIIAVGVNTEPYGLQDSYLRAIIVLR